MKKKLIGIISIILVLFIVIGITIPGAGIDEANADETGDYRTITFHKTDADSGEELSDFEIEASFENGKYGKITDNPVDYLAYVLGDGVGTDGNFPDTYKTTITETNKEIKIYKKYIESSMGAGFTEGAYIEYIQLEGDNVFWLESEVISSVGSIFPIYEIKYKETKAPDDYYIDEKEYIETNVGKSDIYLKNSKKTTKITVEKLLSGEYFSSDENRNYSFNIDLSDKSINGKYGDVSFINGKGSFSIKGNSSINIIGLPIGTEYSIKEDDYTSLDFKPVEEQKGTIDTKDQIIVSFTNEKTTTETMEVTIVKKWEDGKTGEEANNRTAPIVHVESTNGTTLGKSETISNIITPKQEKNNSNDIEDDSFFANMFSKLNNIFAGEIVQAAEVSKSGEFHGLNWTLMDDGELILSGEYSYDGNLSYNSWPWYKGYGESPIKKVSGTPKLSGNLSNMFARCDKLENIEALATWDMSNVTIIDDMFSNCSSLEDISAIENWNTKNITQMRYLFNNCTKLKEVSLNNWNTEKLTSTARMFNSCSQLEKIDLTAFDTSNVTEMLGMFCDCKKIQSLNLENFNTTNATNMEDMFNGCTSLEILNISSFDTNKVTRMGRMFNLCKNLRSIKIGDSFDFKGAVSDTTPGYYALLPTPSTSSQKWIRDDFTFSGMTAEQIQEKYDGNTMAGTWIWDDGKYVTSEDKWVKTDDNTWTYTLTVSNDSLSYKVWEDELKGYNSNTTSTNYKIINKENNSVTITNTAYNLYEGLTINKNGYYVGYKVAENIGGAELVIINANNETIEVKEDENSNNTKLCEPGEEIYRVTTEEGKSTIIPAILPVELSDGSTASYYILETKTPKDYYADNYTMENYIKYYQPSQGTLYEKWNDYHMAYYGKTKNLKEEKNRTIEVRNISEAGSIEIAKFNYYSKFQSYIGRNYKFMIELWDENGKPVNGTFYYINDINEEEKGYYNGFTDKKNEKNSITFENGIAFATIEMGQKGNMFHIYMVPPNYTYKVTEIDDDTYKLFYSILDNEETYRLYNEYRADENSGHYEEYYTSYGGPYTRWIPDISFYEYLQKIGFTKKYPTIDFNSQNIGEIYILGEITTDLNNKIIKQGGQYYDYIYNVDKTDAQFSISANKNINNYDKSKFSIRLTDKDGIEMKVTSFDKDGKIIINDIPIKDINYKKVNWTDMTEEEKEKVKKVYSSSSGMPVMYVDTIPDDAYTIESWKNASEIQIPEDYNPDLYGSLKEYYEIYANLLYYKDANEEDKNKNYWRYNFSDTMYEEYDIMRKNQIAEEPYNPTFSLFYDDEREFYLSEILPEGIDENGFFEGVTYDLHKEKVKVKITGEYGEDPIVTVEYENGEPVFSNKYASIGDITLEGVKNLTGRDIKDGEFTFELKEGNEVIDTVTNKGNNILFKGINYDLEDLGTHTYTISEIKDDVAGVEYDTHIETVIVEVTDNGNGTLKTDIKTDSDGIVFNNTYSASGSAQISATKNLTGRDIEDGEFEFDLKKNGELIETVRNIGNKITFSMLQFVLNDVGIHTYSIIEKTGSLGGIAYDEHAETVTIEVSDNGNGTLNTDVKYDNDDAVFNNKYTASGRASFEGIKTLSGRSLKDGEFEFELKKDENLIETVANKDGKITFADITYTLSDIGTHTYTISEKRGNVPGVEYDTHVETVTVEVSDNGDGTLKADVKTDADGIAFNNTYTAFGDTSFEGTKTLTGRDLQDGEFEFELKEGDNIIETVTNKDGKITFSEINYDLSDVGTHTYTISEKRGNLGGVDYDSHTETITVDVSDNGDGTLKTDIQTDADGIAFNNTYNAQGQTTFIGKKILNNKAMEEFSFVLKEGDTEIATVKNDINGNFTFPEIEYDINDVGEHTYTITEVNDKKPGMTYDEHTEKITVNVTDNGDGTLKTITEYDSDEIVFNNFYNAKGSITIEGKKLLNNKDLKEGEFLFILEDENGNIIETANSKDGIFTFAPITYDINDVGEHIYSIVEKNDASGGITYDEHKENVLVKVSDNGDSTLSTEIVFDNDGVIFTNNYNATGAFEINGVKKLEGADIKENSFAFILTDEEGNVEESVCDSEGKFSFKTINYSLTDIGKEYIYKITEKNDAQENIIYDNHEEIIKVKVEDNGDGNLKIVPEYDNDGVVFTNKYETPITSETIKEETNEIIDKIEAQKEETKGTETGDNNYMLLYTFIAIVAGITITTIIAHRKKNN